MLDKIFTFLFANKVQVVTGTSYSAFMEFERVFVFHKKATEEEIKNSLSRWKYHVKSTKTIRSKSLKCPGKGNYTMLKKKCVRYFDD